MKDEGDGPGIACDIHGRRIAAIVCRHMVEARERSVGFVENSADPEDLQAWCDACEALFVAEGGMTERFRAFNDFAVVCDFCYALLKERHAATGR